MAPDVKTKVLKNPQAAPPSIPSHNSVFGYEYAEGKFIQQQNPEKHFSGVGPDKVGPGHYNQKRSIIEPRTKGVNFAKSTSV